VQKHPAAHPVYVCLVTVVDVITPVNTLHETDEIIVNRQRRREMLLASNLKKRFFAELK